MRLLAILLAAAFLAPQTAEVEITAEPHHHLIFANNFVRVFYVDVPPTASTLTHWHRHDYIYVTLGSADLFNDVEGKPRAQIKLHDAETAFFSAPFAHAVTDLASTPFRNITVELLQDGKLRNTPAHWDEDRGLDILQGGTKEILFVKDAVRATEFELQPRGVIPMHRHSGPYLLIAVSDLDLREKFLNDVHAPNIGPLKTGEVKWLPGGYSHSVTNTAHQPARFIILEFP
jgi:hypothetical protein